MTISSRKGDTTSSAKFRREGLQVGKKGQAEETGNNGLRKSYSRVDSTDGQLEVSHCI